MPDKRERPATPSKSQGNSQKKQPTGLSKHPDDNMDTMEKTRASGGLSYADTVGGLSGGEQPCAPAWFQAFEQRLNTRFEQLSTNLKEEVTEVKEALRFHEETCSDKLNQLEKDLESCREKIDDVENRSRRKNLVFFNFPEGVEKANGSCVQFMHSFLCSVDPDLQNDNVVIERAHRTPTGPPPQPDSNGRQKDRPIHVCFGSFQQKEKVRKTCIKVFKASSYKYKERKLYVGEDLSRRVQSQRKTLLPVLKRLQQEGKKAFVCVPGCYQVCGGSSFENIPA